MTTSKILIINEPFVKDFCRTQRWAARTRGRVLRAPDWLAYATAVLERDGFDVELYDFPAKGWDKDRLYTLVKEKQPALVVLDSTTPSIYSDIDCARLCKEANGDTKILMVGPHVSSLPEETLLESKGFVDAVAIGEYNYTVRDYAKAVLNKKPVSEVKGIAYIEDGKVKSTSPQSLIENLDELPFPTWHHLNLWDYFDGTKLYPYIDLIGGRGCPFKCTWSVNSRADVIDGDLLKYMKKTGCRLLLVGFESGSQKMLDAMHKNITVQKMEEFVKIARSEGLQMHGCFVLGLPGETHETIEETIQFALRNPLNTVQFSGAEPF